MNFNSSMLFIALSPATYWAPGCHLTCTAPRRGIAARPAPGFLCRLASRDCAATAYPAFPCRARPLDPDVYHDIGSYDRLDIPARVAISDLVRSRLSVQRPGGVGGYSWFWVGPAKTDQAAACQRVRGHMGITPRDMVRRDGRLVLPCQAPTAQSSDRYQCVDRMLCYHGGHTVGGLPGEGTPFFFVSADHCKGREDVRELSMGVIRYGVPSPGR